MMRRPRTDRVALSMRLATAGALAAAGLVLTGCVQSPPPFDPRAMQAWERSTDAQVKPAPLYPLPTTQQSQYVPGATQPGPLPLDREPGVPEGPPLALSLQEIVHRAVLNNLDIRVASYDTAVDQTRVMEAQAKFDPMLFTSYQFERVDKQTGYTDATIPETGVALSKLTASDFTSEVVNFDKEAISNFQYGIRQNSETGAQIELKQQVTNNWFNPARTFINPYYDNDLILSVTQPILQNFGVGVNTARITIAQNSQRVSLLDFRKTVEDTVLNIEKNYWALVQAVADVQTVERLVDASERTTDALFHRQQTDVSAVQIEQSNAATDSRRAQLVRARAHVADLSDELKRLMDDPQYPVSGGALVAPIDAGTDAPLYFNLDEQIETGLENRLELGQQQVRIASSEVAVMVAKNNLLPTLNLQGQVTFDGVARSLGDAFNSENNFNHVGFVAGFELDIPLGNRAARSIWQRALDQRQQAIDSYAVLNEEVAKEVKEAAREVHTSWETLKVNRNARLTNERLLAAFQRQQDVGDLPYNPENVQLRLEYQEQLASAEEAEHQSMYDYNFAVANLEKAKGTILRYNNVLLEEEQLPFEADARRYSQQSAR